MKVGILSPIAWRTPPRHYGPWEQFVSLLTEGLVSRGLDVDLYATGDSVTTATLCSAVASGYEEDRLLEPKVGEALHISNFFENAQKYDLLHNSFDFLPLSYSRLVSTPMVTTIHGFSSSKILPVYEKYNRDGYYVSISNADRAKSLDYIDTVYHGIDLKYFDLQPEIKKEYLLFFGRFHHDKGAAEAVQIALKSGMKMKMAGIIQDQDYFDTTVAPFLGEQIEYVGSVGPEARNKILGDAYALLHPINFSEPFGFSVVEAMACGTPVIAFAKGSMLELIQPGQNGYLVDNVDDAVDAIKNLDSLDRATSRRIVEQRFSVNIMVENYIKVYEKILSR
ncbi:MAG: glycosyltransferase family 4 protein [Spirochaetales bacterium]|nr:glycosyltransferase family 4 protein [Spirochaetales bacterium]